MNELQQVIANQDAIKAVEATITRIEEEIRKQEKIISGATVSACRDLDKKREDTLAGIIVGSATSADLAGIDAEIARHAEASAKIKQTAAPARQAVEGLRRRVEQEKTTLKKLSVAREPLVRAALRHEAAAADEERAKAAVVVDQMTRRLIGLSMLLDDRTGRDGEKNQLGIWPLDYAIPRLKIPGSTDQLGVGPHGRFWHHHTQFSTQAPREGWPETLKAAEKYRLFLAGVTLE